ncbi:hypothetical protein AAC387_Pa06g1702 [Persea americana]
MIEFVQKPECILPVINVAPEIIPTQECKLQVVTLEDRFKSEYVDPFWEAIEWQQEASQHVCKVANQIESSIPTTTVISVQHHEDNLKRKTKPQAPLRKCRKTQKRQHKLQHEDANLRTSSAQPRENDAEIDDDLIFVMAEYYLQQWEHPKMARKGPDKF